MEELNRSKTLGRARLSFADQADIDEFVQNLEAFEQGDMASDAWRAFRLLRGTYGQRQEGDLHMMRIKIPQGVLDAVQLRVLGDVADSFAVVATALQSVALTRAKSMLAACVIVSRPNITASSTSIFFKPPPQPPADREGNAPLMHTTCRPSCPRCPGR